VLDTLPVGLLLMGVATESVERMAAELNLYVASADVNGGESFEASGTLQVITFGDEQRRPHFGASSGARGLARRVIGELVQRSSRARGQDKADMTHLISGHRQRVSRARRRAGSGAYHQGGNTESATHQQ